MLSWIVSSITTLLYGPFECLADDIRRNKLTLVHWSTVFQSRRQVLDFADAFKQNTSVTTLRLENIDLGSYDQLEAFVDSLLVQNKCLKNVSLAWNRLNDKGAQVVAKSIMLNRSVTELNLSCNNIGPEGAAKLNEALRVNQTLSSLNLYENHLGPEGVAALAPALLEVNTSLKFLNLNCNNIGVEGALSVADILVKNNSLEHLDLTLNNLGAEGTKIIAEALLQNASVTDLNISSNDFGVEGASAMASMLSARKRKKLKKLSLDYNGFGPEGMVMIVSALHDEICVLRAAGNLIGPKGFLAVADFLKRNDTLRLLDLSSNAAGAKGIISVADALKYNSCLAHIDLTCNEMGQEGKKALGEALVHNVGLVTMRCIYNNCLMEEDIERDKEFLENLKCNTNIVDVSGLSARALPICERNSKRRKNLQMSISTLMALRRWRFCLNYVPKEMIQMIGMHLWKTRGDVMWEF